MCGRARSTTSPHALAQAFGIAPSRVYGAGQYQPRHNFHPGQPGPVLVREDGRPHSYHTHTSSSSSSSTATASSFTSPRPAFPPSAAAQAQAAADARDKAIHRHEGEEEKEGVPPPKAGETAVVVMKWGLVPSWSKESKPDHFRAFNARSEGVAAKPFWKRLVNSRRCVVVLDGCVLLMRGVFRRPHPSCRSVQPQQARLADSSSGWWTRRGRSSPTSSTLRTAAP